MIPGSQIREQLIDDGRVKITIKQNNFFSGIIDKEKRTFYHVPRQSANLFNLFGWSGLGINQEILLRTDFDLIKVKYLDEILTTFRLKWLNKGVTSPYCNAKVDKQIILALQEINMEYQIQKKS